MTKDVELSPEQLKKRKILKRLKKSLKTIHDLIDTIDDSFSAKRAKLDIDNARSAIGQLRLAEVQLIALVESANDISDKEELKQVIAERDPE